MVPSKANEDFLIANAHAKINLHLEVLGIRSDGFHELAMVMQSINLSDQLKMVKSCLLYTSPSPRDGLLSRMPSSA